MAQRPLLRRAGAGLRRAATAAGGGAGGSGGGAVPPVLSTRPAPPPGASARVRATDAPCIVEVKELLRASPGAVSLAQGVVHWGPPGRALDRAAAAARRPPASAYGPVAGDPRLVEALEAKLRSENGLGEVDVMVTSGANQAFYNLAVALLDAGDPVCLFAPYYFNHLMALQMTGLSRDLRVGPRDPQSMQPDLGWLEAELAGPRPPRAVVLVNPCNPTGAVLPLATLERASRLCERAGAWLVVDNTYEHFVFEAPGGRGGGGEGGGLGPRHACVGGPHVANVFSFSKAWGMMGWRVGYLALPSAAGGAAPGLFAEVSKVQDTIPICPSQLGMEVALGALEEGRGWVEERVAGLAANRAALQAAFSPLGKGALVGGGGAIYAYARLPAHCQDDRAAVEWLARRHGVCLIPGAACGSPGHVRAAFANLPAPECAAAAARLHAGLEELARHGLREG